MTALVLLGAGGHAAVLAEAITQSGETLAGYLASDNSAVSKLLGPRLGDDGQIGDLVAQGLRLVIGMGFVNAAGAAHRAAFLASLPRHALATVIHPRAMLSPSARVGAGSFLATGSVLGTASRGGEGFILNSGAVVDHDCSIGRNCHVATGARVAGGVTTGDDVLIGIGATVRQGIRIGEGAVIGAGAVVVSDVPKGAMMLGVPARAVERR